MQHLIVLHTNDIHGRIEGLSRVATLVERAHEDNPDASVVYLDAGDCEDASVRLSRVTKGAAMHRLLSVAGCAAATVGNGRIQRYGPDVLALHAAAASYPLLLANLRAPDGEPLPGVQPSAILDLGGFRLGLIGVTSPMGGVYEREFGLKSLNLVTELSELIAALRQDEADAVILLSHLGLQNDKRLAASLNGLDLIIGAHSHDLLPEGERVSGTTIVQAGQYAEHLGRVDLAWDGESLSIERVSVIPVSDDVPPSEKVLEAVGTLETSGMDNEGGELTNG